MSKDRRLGKGLAALLGTPLEDGDSNLEYTPREGSNAATTNRTLPSRPGAMAPPAAGSLPPSVPALRAYRPEPEESEPTTGSMELNVYEIDNNPFQPRRQFNQEEIAALAESLKEHQQLQPILVRKVGDRYQLISGERRLRAAIHAGLKTVRAELREADDRLVAELAIVENLQRKDLNAIEKAMSFRRYLDEHKCTQDDLAKRLKIDRSTIANLMRLLELPEEILQWIQSDQISAGHARALLPLADEAKQISFATQIQAEQWSVRETERRVAEQLESEDVDVLQQPAPPKGRRKRAVTPQLASLEQELRLALGTKVEIRQGGKGKGKIIVQFSSGDEFDRLRSLMAPGRVQATPIGLPRAS